MSTAFNPADYGLTPEVSVENLTNAHSQYEKLVASLKGETVKTEAPKLENEDEQKLADGFVTSLREELFSTLDANPVLSLVLVDSLSAIVKDVKEFKAWHIANASRNGQAVPVSDAGKEIAEALRDFTERYFKACQDFRIEIPADFPTKKNKDGATVPSFSRLPYEKDSAKAGTKSGGYTLRYRWHSDSTVMLDEDNYGTVLNSEGNLIEADEWTDIPAGTFTDEIAMRYISTPLFRVTGREVFDSLPFTTKETPTGQKRNHLNMPKDGSSVFVQFETGVLEAWLPTNSTETEEVSEEEDSTDEESAEEE